MFYKKNRFYILGLILSFTIFLYGLVQNILIRSKIDNGIKKTENELKNESSNNSYLKNLLTKTKEELQAKKEFKDKLDLAHLKSYEFKNVNDFISSFENLKTRYRGFDKALYKIDEREKSLNIKFNYTTNYRALRSFIYNIEKTYYFTEFNTLKIIRNNNEVKGVISLKAHFGDDADEE